MRLITLLLAFIAIAVSNASVVRDRRHLLQTVSEELSNLSADLDAAKEAYRLTGQSPYETFGNVISGVRGQHEANNGATEEMRALLESTVASIPTYSAVFSVDNTLDLINGAMLENDLITNNLILSAIAELTALSQQKLTQEQDSDLPTLHQKVIGIVRTVLVRNVALSEEASSNGQNTSPFLSNVANGIALIENIFKLMSNVPNYLSVGKSFRSTFNQNNDATSPRNFDSIIEKVSVPLAESKMMSIELPGSSISATLRADALNAAGSTANVLLWATEPDFIKAATETDIRKQLSPVSAGLIFSDGAGDIFNPRSVPDGAVQVTMPFSLGADDVDCRLPCRPMCMFFNKAANNHSPAGVFTGEVDIAASTITCNVASSGYLAVIGAVPASDRCADFDGARGDVCVSMFVPNVQVRLETAADWTAKSMADIQAATSKPATAFGEARLLASNAATGGFTVFFTAIGFNAVPDADVSSINFYRNAQDMYDDLVNQSASPESALRLQPDVGALTTEDSFTQLCEDTNSFRRRCFENKAEEDDDDDDTVMIVAIIGGVGAVGAIAGAAMYMKKKK